MSLSQREYEMRANSFNQLFVGEQFCCFDKQADLKHVEREYEIEEEEKKWQQKRRHESLSRVGCAKIVFHRCSYFVMSQQLML